MLIQFSDEEFVARVAKTAVDKAAKDAIEVASSVDSTAGGAKKGSRMRSGKFVGVVDGFKTSLKSLIMTLQVNEPASSSMNPFCSSPAHFRTDELLSQLPSSPGWYTTLHSLPEAERRQGTSHVGLLRAPAQAPSPLSPRIGTPAHRCTDAHAHTPSPVPCRRRWDRSVSARQLASAGLVQAVDATRSGYSDHLSPAHIVSVFGALSTDVQTTAAGGERFWLSFHLTQYFNGPLAVAQASRSRT